MPRSFAPRRHRPLGHRRRPVPRPEGREAALQRIHLLDVDVGGQPGQMALQFGQRHLTLAVADDKS